MSQRRRNQSMVTVEGVISKKSWQLTRGLDHKCFFRQHWLSIKDWRWYEPHLILIQGSAVGFAAIRPNSNLSLEKDSFFSSPGTVYLGRIGILPLFQGRGLASRFLNWLIDWSEEAYYSRIACHCAVNNRGSRALLEKFRFKNIGTVGCPPIKPTAPPLRIIVWERPLAASLPEILSG